MPKTLHFYVDEAGDPVLFARRRRSIVGTEGCSRYFILGMLEVDDPAGLARKLTALRQKLLADPIFAGVESFKRERKKTAVLFHAKDDLPEVRLPVFQLLREQGEALRFYAVVCDKEVILREVQARNQAEPDYHFKPNHLYNLLMRYLLGSFHRVADSYQVCVARRGKRDRNEAMVAALEHAETDFEKNFGFNRGGKAAWSLRVSAPEQDVPLQAADYFLWALQRFYEPRLDARTGAPLRDQRFIGALWPQVGEIHDLHFGPATGTRFDKNKPLTMGERFTEPKKNQP